MPQPADRLCRHFQTSLSEVRSSLKGEIPAVDGGLADIKATVCCPQTHSTEDSLKRNNSVTPDRELNWTTGMWCTIYFHLRLHWKSVFKDKDLVSHCLVLCFILERWHAKDTLFCVRSKYRLFYYITLINALSNSSCLDDAFNIKSVNDAFLNYLRFALD